MAAVTIQHAMVLAAGLGTRLRPLTDELPKPAVPVLNRPLAAPTLDHLARLGVQTIGFNTHHLGERLRAALEPEVSPSIRALFVHEREILGTGGGIRNTWRALGEPELLLVTNGDVQFEPDVVAALAHHVNLGAIATMVLRPTPDVARYGAIGVDTAGRVRSLLGLPRTDQSVRELMFTGVHILSAAAITQLPEQGCVVRQGYRQWIDQGALVAGFVDTRPWRELGTPAEYAEAQLTTLGGSALIDPSALVQPQASVRQSVIGAGCHVAGGVTLERVIAWPGAALDEDMRDCIVLPSGQRVSWGAQSSG